MKLMNALEKHNPNKQISPLNMLQNYDKPGGPLPGNSRPVIPTNDYLNNNQFN